MIAKRRWNALDYWNSPLEFVANFWPDVRLYNKQREILESIALNDETYVPAANMMGKDFVSGLAVLWFFLTRSPCRIVTTSVKDDHLSVLWGEIGRFIDTCRFPLDVKRGGPLQITHREMRKMVNGRLESLSYVKGMVAAQGAAMQGHHIALTGDGIPRTFFFVDESSGVQDEYYKMANSWANRILSVGNTWTCNNFFYRAVMGNLATGDPGGDMRRENGDGYHRKVIKITVDDSPNVRKAHAQIKRGIEPTGEVVIPGVKTWGEYQKNLKMWDPVQQTVSLWAEFDESGLTWMFPKEWLDLAERLYDEEFRGKETVHMGRRTMGQDSALGGDNTGWCVVDPKRLLKLRSEKTPDTNVIPGTTIAEMKEWGVKPQDVAFDYGGGGKNHVDRLRAMGYPVRSVRFGDPIRPEPKHGLTPLAERREIIDERRAYKNRRAEMYGTTRDLFEPILDVNGKLRAKFAVPREVFNRKRSDGGPSLREQLSKVPLLYDGEGQLYLPPKNPKPGVKAQDTMIGRIGCSPDESDAFVLACWMQTERSRVTTAGVPT